MSTPRRIMLGIRKNVVYHMLKRTGLKVQNEGKEVWSLVFEIIRKQNFQQSTHLDLHGTGVTMAQFHNNFSG